MEFITTFFIIFFGILLLGILGLIAVQLGNISYGVKQAGIQLVPIAKLSDTALQRMRISERV